MKHGNLADIRNDVLALTRDSPLGEQLFDVQVEPGDDGEGGEFLRVLIELKDPSIVKFEDVRPLLESIEDAVSTKDDRFPSVRFLDAA